MLAHIKLVGNVECKIKDEKVCCSDDDQRVSGRVHVQYEMQFVTGMRCFAKKYKILRIKKRIYSSPTNPLPYANYLQIQWIHKLCLDDAYQNGHNIRKSKANYKTAQLIVSYDPGNGYVFLEISPLLIVSNLFLIGRS